MFFNNALLLLFLMATPTFGSIKSTKTLVLEAGIDEVGVAFGLDSSSSSSPSLAVINSSSPKMNYIT